MQELVNLKIFEWLEKETIQYIISNCKKESFLEWEIILLQGDESNGKWYIIQKGEVSVKIWENEVACLWVGEIFGEIALLNEEKRTATVIAKTPVECIILSQDNLFEMINNGNESINRDIMERIEQNLWNNA